VNRRELIAFPGGTAAAWPLALRAQQPGMPVIEFFNMRHQVRSSGHCAHTRCRAHSNRTGERAERHYLSIPVLHARLV
jgi:hypothetical protein